MQIVTNNIGKGGYRFQLMEKRDRLPMTTKDYFLYILMDLLMIVLYSVVMFAKHMDCMNISMKTTKLQLSGENVNYDRNWRFQGVNASVLNDVQRKNPEVKKSSVATYNFHNLISRRRNKTANKYDYDVTTKPLFTTTGESVNATDTVSNSTEMENDVPLLYRIHSTLTRSKDAVWATISLTFMCIVLVLAVAQSRMWKDYHGSNTQASPLPTFNERVPFKEVVEHKMKILKELLTREKRSKKSDIAELESLLHSTEIEEEK